LAGENQKSHPTAYRTTRPSLVKLTMRQTTKPYISEVSALVTVDTAYKKSYSAITITVADVELINRRRARWGMLKAIGQLVTLFFISCIIVYMVVQEYLPPIDE